MTVPFFDPDADPGPSFTSLLRATGHQPPALDGALDERLQITHGTTVVAIRYADGAVMAGDRRATSGHMISHRTIEKVFPADRWSGVAIAGAAGPAMEMVKLFQLQLEHYEKVEGAPLSLEGKANQLSSMVRSHLPAAMQGLAVVPLFAGYDTRRGTGRLFQYDVTGGRYEENDYATSGSGGLHAATVVKLGFAEGLSRIDALDLAMQALITAADEDSATGGPDPRRGIWPVVATIAAEGFTRSRADEVKFTVMPLALQAKLLRFLQERVIERVGGREEIPVDVRVVCATNKNLQQMVKDETFREDLYYRICEMEIHIPPLRERQGDKLLLARHFLRAFAEQNNSSVTGFSPEAVEAIETYSWPGNIREMENRVKRSVVMAEDKLVGSQDLGIAAPETLSINLRQVRQTAEKNAIMRALTVTESNISATAKLLGVTRPTLYDLLKKYNIQVPGAKD